MGAIPVRREQRKLAAILAADIVGYSRLIGDLVESPQRGCVYRKPHRH
jgi:hypothetical protein